MFLTRHLSALSIYLVLLLILSSDLIIGITEFQIINFIVYLFIHFLLIYLAIYHFTTILYYICFFLGIIIDIFLLNEIGTHIISFMLLILLIHKLKKYINSLSSIKIYFIIIVIVFFALLFEKLVTALLFNINFEVFYFIKSIFFILIISYPAFYIFNKIDQFG